MASDPIMIADAKVLPCHLLQGDNNCLNTMPRLTRLTFAAKLFEILAPIPSLIPSTVLCDTGTRLDFHLFHNG
jgi:hypothetical protein